LAVFLVLFASAAGAQTSEDRTTTYARLWLQAGSGLMQISSNKTLDAEKPEPKMVQDLRSATDRLENAVSGMLRTFPPEESTRAHVVMVPLLIEVIGAARRSLYDLENNESAKAQANLEWLDEAIAQARSALAAAIRQ